MKERIFLFGYSGHALVVNDCIDHHNYEPTGYFDRNEKTNNPLNLTYCGDETRIDISEIIGSSYAFPAIGNNKIREKLVYLFETKKIKQIVLKHSSAIVSKYTNVGNSTMIGPGAIVNALAEIGKGVILNSGVIVEHECLIENYVHIAPGAVLAGNVHVGEHAFIGSNSFLKEGVTLGKNCIIGAGSVVLTNIPENETWVGNPAKKIQ